MANSTCIRIEKVSNGFIIEPDEDTLVAHDVVQAMHIIREVLEGLNHNDKEKADED